MKTANERFVPPYIMGGTGKKNPPGTFTDARGKTRYRDYVCGTKLNTRPIRDKAGKIVSRPQGYRRYKLPVTALTPEACRAKALELAAKLGETHTTKARDNDTEHVTLARLLQAYQDDERQELFYHGEIGHSALSKDGTSRNAICAVLGPETPIRTITEKMIRGDKEHDVPGVNGTREQDQRNLTYLREALEYARVRGWIDENPAAHIKNRKPLPHKHPFGKRGDIPGDVLRKLFAHIDGIVDPYQRAYALAFYYLQCLRGLRVSEALALRWSKLDTERGTWVVDEQVNKWQVLKNGSMVPPKSDAGVRIITLGPTMVKLLIALKREQDVKTAARQRNLPSRDLDLVFPSPEGRPFRGNNFRLKYEEPLFLAADLPTYVSPETGETKAGYSAHWFRHTALTWLRALARTTAGFKGAYVSDEAGHERTRAIKDDGIGAATETYSHVDPSETVAARLPFAEIAEARVNAHLPEHMLDAPARVVPLRRAS